MRHRREIRGIGLNEHAVERHDGGRVANVLRLGIGDVAGEGNDETQIERGLGVLDRAGEAVQDAARVRWKPSSRVSGAAHRPRHSRCCPMGGYE